MPKENADSDVANLYKTVFSQGQTAFQTEEIKKQSEKDQAITSGLKKCMIRVQRIKDDFTDQGPFVTICLLDCCRVFFRRNPDLVTWKDPFAKVESSDQGPNFSDEYLIAFACTADTKASDNNQGNNGLYTKHLLQHIVKPNIRIIDALAAVREAVIKESSRRQIPEALVALSPSRYISLCDENPGT
jgi:hypothetical protein